MDFDLVDDPEVIAGYLTDASNVPGRAEALVRPRSTAEVAEVVAHCQRERIPLTVTAGRTSTTGAAVPRGGWLLSMEALSQMGAVSATHATAQGGILLGAMQAHVEAKGRFYPPDPTSRHDCTLGATIACNASGARSFRYGPTRRLGRGESRWFSPRVDVRQRSDAGDPIPCRLAGCRRWSPPASQVHLGVRCRLPGWTSSSARRAPWAS